MTKKLTPWISPGTGEVIQTVPVSYFAVIDAIRREPGWEEPEPPWVEVEIAGTRRPERNYADPDYPKSYRIWESRLELEANGRILRRIAIKQTLTAAQETEVADLRAALPDEQLHPDDRVVWLLECAIGNGADTRALIRFVTGQADPQEERVEKKASPSD